MRLLRSLRMPWGQRQDGQAMVEAAMVLPILVFLTLGVLVFGLFVNTKLAVSGAAREAARNYAIYQEIPRAVSVARDYLAGSLLAGEQELTCVPGTASPPCSVLVEPDGEYVSVRVVYWQKSIAGGLFGLPDRIPLSAAAVFRMEQ